MLSRLYGVGLAAAVRQYSALSLVAEKSIAAAASTSASANGKGRDTLGRRLFSLIYPKRSAVAVLCKWKEEGHTVRKYELNRIVRELRKLRRYKHALEICEWMRKQEDFKLLPGDYAIHLDLILKIRGLNSASKFFIDLPEKLRGPETCTALLHAYVQEDAYVEAEALMEKMAECNFIKCCLPYNHMLSLYINRGQLEEVPDVIKRLKKETSPNIVTYNLWLTSCSSQNDIETAERVFQELNGSKSKPDWVTYSTLASLYIKNGMKEKAVSALKAMEKEVSRKHRPSFSSLISLHASVGDKDGVQRVWKKVKSLYRKASDSEYNCMISSLIKLGLLEEAEKLYDEWESVSTSGDSRVPNLLLAAYISNGINMEKAKSFHDRIVHKGIKSSYSTWELLTLGYLKHGQMAEAFDCFDKSVDIVKKWEPNENLIRKMFERLEEEGNVKGAEKLLVILRRTGHVTTEIYNMLLRTYARAGVMPLVIAERMEKDEVVLDEGTKELIRTTSRMCVGEVPSCLP